MVRGAVTTVLLWLAGISVSNKVIQTPPAQLHSSEGQIRSFPFKGLELSNRSHSCDVTSSLGDIIPDPAEQRRGVDVVTAASSVAALVLCLTGLTFCKDVRQSPVCLGWGPGGI
ncbi:hypothetical protein GN956_G25581 [Arapaima gigas]